ncbi:hypothetical protein MNBD_GAMMA05-1593 [hydrothermal vent metagenome]|uniref:Lipoprotein n=1 Tax=hydrothermal vent metagenome TaxID=652676 RepID=A0A3B0WF68_9ZZZZ
MKKIIATTFALSAITLMSGCSSSDGDGSPPGGAGADPISIVTVTGAQHVLTGVHATACYDDGGSGRIDVLTVTGAEWTNESNIYSAIDCTGGIVQTGRIIANIAGANNDTQTSGWKGQGDIAPQRADATGSLSENETITPFDIEVTAVIDPTQLFGGNVNVGFKATAFYVFDDTAGGDTYVMYRDDDGVFASASDPYIQGAASTGSSLNFPILAISGNQFELTPSVGGSTFWASGCYINGSIDSEQLTSIGAIGVTTIVESTQQNYLSSDGSCIDPTESFDITYNITLDATTEAIVGWVDDVGSSVAAPQKQDNSVALSNTESYSNMTWTVTSVSANLALFISIGDVFPSAYIVDDSTSIAVLYVASPEDNTGDVIAPLFLQLP